MVDFFLLITLAGAGDELQGMKRGVMELADLVAINKADGANLAAAERARNEAAECVALFSRLGVWMDAARTDLLGANRQGHCRALELRTGTRRAHQSQRLVQS